MAIALHFACTAGHVPSGSLGDNSRYWFGPVEKEPPIDLLYDGKPYAITGNFNFDTVKLTRTNSREVRVGGSLSTNYLTCNVHGSVPRLSSRHLPVSLI